MDDDRGQPEQEKMPKHRHDFVEHYDGLIGFGFDRPTDENTLICYLQKFSDDRLLDLLVKKMSDEDLGALFDMVTAVLHKYLTESEYHRLFLKDDHP